jgi:crotonobetainyl-CoA:carnitine CoA-transferase CaiB-like acyl-CoA transferase
VLGIPEVAADPRFARNADRTANRAELHPVLVARLAAWNADDLFLALNRAGVPCGPINSVAEGVALAEQLGLAPRVTVGQGDRAVDLVANPLTMSGATIRYDLPPPGLDEHGVELRAWLGSPPDSRPAVQR